MNKQLLATAVALCSTAAAFSQNTPISQMEKLNRGVVALPASSGSGNFISWRLLGTDDEERTTFDVIRNTTTVARDRYVTNYVDAQGSASVKYRIVTKVDGVAVDTTEAVPVWANLYKKLVLDRPATGANGGTYSPNDCSVGDVDGDGEYEIILKWDPSNAKDNSQSGITDNVFLDCYKLDGTKLWRIDLGRNIRAGAHYTQFMVYDFDGDGKAELMCKTGPGSLDGKGEYVNTVATDDSIKAVSGTALYRSDAGRITGGQEWLTVFRGETGEAIHTIFYNPNRNMTYGGAADGSVNWGVGGKNDTGSYGNRGERFLAGVAHLDGPDQNASGIFSRGYYDYAFIWAVDFDGQQLHQKWLSAHKSGTAYTLTTYDADGKGTSKTFSNCKPTSGSGSGTMYGNGNHNLSIADVDGDGCDEIIWGSAGLDNDGKLLYGTGFGHGDAIHLADHCPDRPGLEVFQVHEEKGTYAWDLHDAATGVILQKGGPAGVDNGRGMAGAFDSQTRGSLMWSASDGTARSAVTGQTVYEKGGSTNFRIYWDGDLQDELLDGNKLDKFNNGAGSTSRLFTIYNAGPGSTCNGSKNTPNLQADILGDWREEVILYSVTDAETCLGIYSSNIATTYRMPTLMHDNTYRKGICWQNTAYNQPPHLGYYLPDAMLPHMLNGDRYDIEATVGDSLLFQSKARYTASASMIASFTPDGTRKSYLMPEGFERVSFTAKTLTLKGVPQEEGDFRFVIKLTGLNKEVVNDTIVVHAKPAAQSGIAEAQQGHQVLSRTVFDAAGRQLPATGRLPKGINIIRETTPQGVITRKTMVK
ncbi:MAG: rhamnogalacturonan lyase [Prevotella sp.]|nr:rhamnogalacturonan lyase [Prevotella sp.]